jgi:hypothetical protein
VAVLTVSRPLAIEAGFPRGWEVSVSVIGLWFATRREPLQGYGMVFRPILGAGDPAGLRAAIRSFGA